MALQSTLKGIIESLGLGPDLNGFLALFGLALGRIAMAVSLCPFLGGNAAPGPARMALSTMITLLLTPSLAQSSPLSDIDPMLWIVLLLKELALGATIGVLSQLIFFSVQTAGALADAARGMDQPGLTTPQLRSNTSALGQLKFQMALVLFLTVNGHLIYLRSIALSFQQIPLRNFARFESAGIVDSVTSLSGQVFLVALQLAAPVMLALFLVDVCFAALAKVSPRMHIYSESQPLKAMAGLVVLLLAIGLIATRIEDALSGFLWQVYKLIPRLA